jgi:acyl transferase domain-containing protein
MPVSQVPIAIIGIGCRFPGGANDPQKLWQMLSEGRDAWTEVPEDRFNWKSFYHPYPEAQGMHNHRGGHFIDQNLAAFDSAFFEIPVSESEAIDPQHRIQLETCYEACENAGIPIDDLRGSNTAVYVATFSHDYAVMQFKDLDNMSHYHSVGVGTAIASNRLSYTFDLKGPSVTIDTGCSGSLVAIHQACQSLRTGECDLALAGGSNLILNPDAMIPLSHAQCVRILLSMYSLLISLRSIYELTHFYF